MASNPNRRRRLMELKPDGFSAAGHPLQTLNWDELPCATCAASRGCKTLGVPYLDPTSTTGGFGIRKLFMVIVGDGFE
jgi:hypothetical protein